MCTTFWLVFVCRKYIFHEHFYYSHLSEKKFYENYLNDYEIKKLTHCFKVYFDTDKVKTKFSIRSMIHSARPTEQVDFEKYGQTKRGKTMITAGRDCG